MNVYYRKRNKHTKGVIIWAVCMCLWGEGREGDRDTEKRNIFLHPSVSMS